MTLREQLAGLIEAFSEASGLSISRVSTLIFGGGHRATRLIAGETDVNTATYERAVQYMSDNWPEGHPWPGSIPRPETSRGEGGSQSAAAPASPHVDQHLADPAGSEVAS